MLAEADRARIPGLRAEGLQRLEEGRRVRLAYGVGYHSDDGLGGLFNVTRSNIAGRGDRRAGGTTCSA